MAIISNQDLHDAMSNKANASKFKQLKAKFLAWLEKKWEAWMNEVRTWE